MPVTMATTVDLAATVSKENPTVTTTATHTPPPTGIIVVVDNTVKNTGRTTMATQASLTVNNKSNHS